MLSVLWSLVLWLLAPGLFGLDANQPVTTSVTATVTKGAGCGQAEDGELVTFKQDGKQHQAKLDGCGHTEGEPVDVSVPAGASGDLVVHAAEAAVGESDGSRPVAFILFLLANLAGGGFAYIYLEPKFS